MIGWYGRVVAAAERAMGTRVFAVACFASACVTLAVAAAFLITVLSIFG